MNLYNVSFYIQLNIAEILRISSNRQLHVHSLQLKLIGLSIQVIEVLKGKYITLQPFKYITIYSIMYMYCTMIKWSLQDCNTTKGNTTKNVFILK